MKADGQYFAIFDDGHHRQLPRLISGPFKYKTYAYDNFKLSQPYATQPMKQAVIAPSMLYLTYPLAGEVPGYPKTEFVKDLVAECVKDIRGCFAAGAKRVSLISPRAGWRRRTTRGTRGRARTCCRRSSI